MIPYPFFLDIGIWPGDRWIVAVPGSWSCILGMPGSHFSLANYRRFASKPGGRSPLAVEDLICTASNLEAAVEIPDDEIGVSWPEPDAHGGRGGMG
jgi:hypothetical protein